MGDEQERLRAEWIEAHGAWNDDWTDFVQVDPGFFEGYLALAAHPWRGGALEPKIKALVQLSVDAAATHLWGPGVRHHVRRALALGASEAEIIETLELTATMGIHACNVGVPLLLEELEAAGQPLERGPLSERQEEIVETLLQAAVYCGVPAGIEAFRRADSVIASVREAGESQAPGAA